MQFKPFEPNIEVNGNTAYAIVAGFGIVKILAKPHLRRAGLPEILDKNDWYSQEKWLAAFESVSKIGGDGTLFRIGLQIPRNATFPAWMKTIEDAVKSIDIAYHMNHRKNNKIMFNSDTGKMTEGIGHYGYTKIEGQNLIISVCNNPYPYSFDKGIITAMAQKFQPDAKVTHDDSKPCRKKGDDSCTYTISW
jgi:hypothetical protein